MLNLRYANVEENRPELETKQEGETKQNRGGKSIKLVVEEKENHVRKRKKKIA